MTGRHRWLLRWILAECKAAERLLPPPTRGDCIDGPRPCPHKLCKWHNAHRYHYGRLVALDNDYGERSCALDTIDDGDRHLPTIAAAIGATHQRAHQLVTQAMAKCKDTLLHRTLSMKDEFESLQMRGSCGKHWGAAGEDIDLSTRHADEDNANLSGRAHW